MNTAISMSYEWHDCLAIKCFQKQVMGTSLVAQRWESACQCRTHGSDPSSRKIPPTTNHMSHNYWACSLEPGSHNFWVHVLQLLTSKYPRDHALQQEKPLQWEASTPQLGSSLHLQQLENSPSSHRNPAQPGKSNRQGAGFGPPTILSSPEVCAQLFLSTRWKRYELVC